MRKQSLDFFMAGRSFNPASLSSKFAGWWIDGVDQLTSGQSRTTQTQNSLPGQLFPGRSILYDGATQNSLVSDSGALNGTIPLSVSFWLKPKTIVGTSYLSNFILGKASGSFVSGRWGVSFNGTGIRFWWHTSTGLAAKDVNASGIAVDTWTHIVCVLGATAATVYVNGTAVSGTTAVTGTFAALTSEKFRIGSIQDASGYANFEIRDIRLFMSTELSTGQVTSLYNGDYVSGFTQWWMCSDNSTTRLHSAKNGGLHGANNGFNGSSFQTGYFRQPYNEYGYAENATYGQIPPDMSSSSPTNDCYGNALVFSGQAKYDATISGSNYTLFSGAYSSHTDTLINSCDLISLDTWFSSGVAQTLTPTAYCASRQFYKSGHELIIIKEGQHLTTSEESNLMSYLGSPTIPTSYHANTTALFARFTNTYTDKEKSRIDNVMRLLVSNSIYAKLEVFVLSATSGLEEQLLDWISSANNLVPANPSSTETTSQLPYRGLAPQNDCWKNAFNPSTATLTLQNDAFMAFKLSEAVDVPFGSNNGGRINGIYNAGVSNFYSMIDSQQRIVVFYIFSNGASANYTYTSPIDTKRTYLGNRTASNVTAVYASRANITTAGTTVSAARPNSITYVGNVKNIAANSPVGAAPLNWIQHYANGGSLTTAQAKIYTAIIDNFCDGQRALIDDEWIYTDNYKLLWSNKFFIDRLGDQVIWTDGYTLYYSIDGGVTVTSSVAFNGATLGWPHMAHIFDNGKIIFATNKNKIYKTTTANFSNYSEMSPTKNGSPYTIHTPSSSTYPGEYYKFLGVKKKQYLDDGTEIFVWNNYGVSIRGACPGIVWYSFGDEIKVAYELGTNPYIRDNGSPGGGTTGTFLGDAAVLNWVRHGHGVQQRSDDATKFISMWGDLNRAALSPAVSSFFECQFLAHTYDQNLDSWSTSIIKQGDEASRWKATSGQMPGDGYIYWTSDAGITGGNQAERGYFKSLIANLGDGSETRFYNPLLALPSNMFHLDSDGFFMGGGYAATGASAYGGYWIYPNIIWSDDMVTFHEERLPISGNTYIFEIIKLSTKKYLLNYMSDYDYMIGARSAIIDFN